MEAPYTPTRNPPLANHEATTRRKAKFFEAFDSRALVQVIFEEFEEITTYEVRARIAEMPWRYRQLVETGGKRIKSSL